MNVSELTGAALDHWVARAHGYKTQFVEGRYWRAAGKRRKDEIQWVSIPNYSDSWALAGPIIERERIKIGPHSDDPDMECGWEKECNDDDWYAMKDCTACSFGATPLIAAMRAYVASKFGSEVSDESI
jgi:Protein of unknown function (DUF2591)